MEGFEVQQIIHELKPQPPKKDIELITHAYDFALKAHSKHTRFSGEPYFIHVFETAKNLARYEMDATTIAAGFLHDTLEDTPITEEEMEEEFGPEIVGLIKGVTKLGKIKYRGHARHVESLRKFLLALAQDYRVLMIKLADRLHNLRTLQHVRPDKQRRIALESIEVYAPLADRLGIGRLKGEIEDAAFPFAYPKEAEMIEEILREKGEETKKSLESVYGDLTRQLSKTQIKVHKVDYRIKHKYSLWKKLQKYEMNIENIYDIVALRVIVESVEECYAVLGLIHSTWKPLPGRIKDYIALPKLNGYQSIHTTVFTGTGGIVEIQIRTQKMHGRAEYGIASHGEYKEKSKNNNQDEKFQWINNLTDMDTENPQQEDFLKSLKADFFNDRIFVFTPEGEVIDLPKESTPIDFAYAVHSDIGNTSSSAKINGKMAALNTKLHSSDIVEIQTRKDGSPKSKWLDFVKTSVAKKHIRNYLNEHSEGNLLRRFFPKSLR